MRHLDEGRIHAWLDGALGDDDARATEAHVSQCAECGARVAAARGVIAASSRILSALDHVPAGVIPDGAGGSGAAARPGWGRRYARLAAMIGFIAVGTLVATRGLNRHEATARRLSDRSASRPYGAPRDAAAAAQARAAVPRGPDSTPRRLAVRAPEAVVRSSLPSKVAAPSSHAGAVANRPAPALDAPVETAPASAGAADAAPAAPRANALRESERAVTALGTVTALRLVSVDTVHRDSIVVRRSVYELGSGVRVTLEASDAEMPAPLADSSESAVAKRATPAAINAIRWRGADGVRYVLSGPMTVQDLERVRAQLRR